MAQTAITNLKDYNKRLHSSMEDKLDFLNHIPKNEIDAFIDFGCGDGKLLEYIAKQCPEAELFGYDIDDSMLKIAKERKGTPDVIYCSDLDFLLEHIIFLQSQGKRTCLVLNSVLHEIHTFGTTKIINQFWDEIFQIGFDYICIRDMGISFDEFWEPVSKEILYNLVNHIGTAAQQYQSFNEKIRMSGHQTKDLDKTGFVYEFLLKYRYIDNWKRELDEQYLQYIDKYLGECEHRDYQVVHFERYILPFIKKSVKEDFNIDMEVNTHFKLILEKFDD